VVTLLERLGCEVDFPEAQTCCGQMHTNTGYRERGLTLARRFERVFADADVVVSPSASCVAYLRENGAGLDGRLAELTEFLVDRLGVEDIGATFPHKVTLHPTCHSVRLMGIGDRPRRLLEHVRGIDLIELEDAAEYCGFGGTFAVKNADTSMAMLSTSCEMCWAAGRRCVRRPTTRVCCTSAGRSGVSAPGCASCTWPRSWRRREQDRFPRCRAQGARRHPDAPQRG
jgi:L-lactate dehydrogenase complex protein LldE